MRHVAGGSIDDSIAAPSLCARVCLAVCVAQFEHRSVCVAMLTFAHTFSWKAADGQTERGTATGTERDKTSVAIVCDALCT